MNKCVHILFFIKLVIAKPNLEGYSKQQLLPTECSIAGRSAGRLVFPHILVADGEEAFSAASLAVLINEASSTKGMATCSASNSAKVLNADRTHGPIIACLQLLDTALVNCKVLHFGLKRRDFLLEGQDFLSSQKAVHHSVVEMVGLVRLLYTQNMNALCLCRAESWRTATVP